MSGQTDGREAELPRKASDAELALATQLYKPLRRSASLANFSGSCLLLFGIPTLLLSLLGPDAVGIVLGAALCTCGTIELTAVKRVRAGDPAALTRLGWNQWAVFALIAGYAGLQLLGFDADETRAELERQGLGADALGELGDLVPTMVYTIYTSVILVSFLFQGLMARMYFKRRELATRYTAEVPEWIRRMVAGLGT
jgi:hypothetical protein